MAAIGTLLDSLHTSGFFPGWQPSRIASAPKVVAGAAVSPEHTRIEESK